jgi:hypothetical protein
MSPSVTSSGPTTLTCLLDSLARGTHSCAHVHSKQNPTVRLLPQIYDADLFGVSGFRASGVRASHISNFRLSKSQNYGLLLR